MKILSVDLGKVRTGLAVSDIGEVLASPLCVIAEKNAKILAENIDQVCNDERIAKIVLGLPKNMDGSEGESAQNAKTFGKMLEEKTQLPVILLDERGTTITAHNYLNETNTRGKKRKRVVDAVAATVILQAYLDGQKSERVDQITIPIDLLT